MSTSTSTPDVQATSTFQDPRSLNILSIGGSRNIGYYASLKLLQKGATVTFLLRNPSIFDNDTSIQPFISSGHAHIVKGDALVKEDVAKAWKEAISQNEETRVDYLLFTLGGTPKFSATKGFIITPPNLVTISLLNTLSTLPPSLLSTSIKIITISSIGLTPTSHASLPLLLKPMYSYLLSGPHIDKVGAERLLHHVTANWEWNSNTELEEGILPGDWEKTEGLMQENALKHVVVIRPSLLTDGESLGEKYDESLEASEVPVVVGRKGKKEKKEKKEKKKPYRVETEREVGGYTVSRKDVAHFMVDLVLKRWDEFENKIVNISY